MMSRIDMPDLAVRGDDLHVDDGVLSEPVQPALDTETAAERETRDTHGRTRARGDGPPVTTQPIMQGAELGTGSDHDTLVASVVRDAVERTRIDHHPAGDHRRTHVRVPARLRPHRQVVLAGEPHRLAHVVCVLGADDAPRPATVETRIERMCRRAVALVARSEHGSL